MPRGIESLGVQVYHHIDEVLPRVDVLNVLRIQLERDAGRLLPSIREYHNFYGITRQRLERAGREITIMHPGPINRDVEISADVADGEQSVILQQVLNGVAIRMAVLYLLSSMN
jgi:aspartate carbamoyltransferase catalytic subunit